MGDKQLTQKRVNNIMNNNLDPSMTRQCLRQKVETEREMEWAVMLFLKLSRHEKEKKEE